MFKLYIFLISFLSIQTVSAQQPVLQWAKSFNSDNVNNYSQNSNGRTVGVDQQGNVYSAGLFQYKIDFDPGPGKYSLDAATQYNTSIYVSKLDANGNFVWAVQVPALVEFGFIELKVDKDGNVYLTSEFRDAADMDPGPGVYMMKPTGYKDAFVIKLNTDGNLVWAKQFGGPGDTGPQPSVLDIDKDNNVIVCGIFNNTVDFDPGPGVFNLTSTAHQQSFIVKLDNNGDLIWAKQFGNSPIVYNNATIADVKCDPNGNIYTVGGFAGTCDFDPGTAVYNLTSNSIRDGFVAKLTPKGDFVWAKSIRNTTTEHNYLVQSLAIDIDSKNNVVTTGCFIGAFDFDPGPGVNNVTSLGSYDCYVFKLTEQGDPLWLKVIGGSEGDFGNDMVVGSDDNIYVIGSFSGTVDFDPGPGVQNYTSSYYDAPALIKLSADGGFVYAAHFSNTTSGTSVFRRMAMDPSLNIYIAGTMGGIVDFDPGPGVYSVSSNSGGSPLVLKFGPCANRTASTLQVSACDHYTLNNEQFDTTGVYTRVIPNASGCDSVITLHLTITRKLVQQTKSICEGEFFFAGGANQSRSGTYVDTLQTAQGCDSIVTTLLTVSPLPAPNLGTDKNLCNGVPLTVTPGTFASYLWQDMSNAGSLTIKTPGIYWVKVTNSFNCQATDTLRIPAIVPTPSNFLKETDSICAYGSLEVLPAKNYSQYQWSTGTTAENVTVKQPGIYWLTVTDADGCSGRDSITVFEKHCLAGFYIPSGFSPNGDGKNDVFKPLLFSKVKQYRFAIYNRWGAVVFQTTDPRQGWDGKIAGAAQANGLFAWTCSYQFEGAEPKTEKGTLTLLR